MPQKKLLLVEIGRGGFLIISSNICQAKCSLKDFFEAPCSYLSYLWVSSFGVLKFGAKFQISGAIAVGEEIPG